MTLHVVSWRVSCVAEHPAMPVVPSPVPQVGATYSSICQGNGSGTVLSAGIEGKVSASKAPSAALDAMIAFIDCVSTGWTINDPNSVCSVTWTSR